MAISNMQQPQQIQSGIGSLQDPRQGYFLGKLVKKAGRAVKKVVKSPLGKMALIGGLGYGLGGAKFLGGKGIFAGGQAGRFGNLLNLIRPAATNAMGKDGILSSLFYNPEGKFSLGRAALTGLGAAGIAAPFFMGGDDEEEIIDVMDPRYQVQRAKNYYSGAGDAGAGLDFMPLKQYVQPNFYAADGGIANIDMPKRGMVDGPGSYAGRNRTKFLMPENMDRDVPNKFDFLTTTGPLTDQQKEILANMTEEEVKELQEKGTLFDFLENIIKTPFIMRGGDMTYADGGRANLNMGGDAGQAQAEQMLMMEYVKYKNKGGTLSFEQFVKAVMQEAAPEGAGMEQPQPVMMAANGGPVPGSTVPGYTTPAGYNKFDYRSGGVPVRVGAQEGGIMETEEASEMIDMGGMEKDYRNEGGFVAIGGRERADDVPARLSKNEFVFTADAVRNAGGGDIDKGAEVMENLMNNLEQGGEVSEDSQGLEGAQAMYDQQQMLQSRMI